MKKLFGHKPKTGKSALGSRDFSEDGLRPPIPTPLYNKHATHGNPMAGPLNQPFAGHHVTDEELWEVVQPTPSSTADSPRIPGVQPPPPPSIKAPPSRSGSFTSLPQSHGTGGISASAAPPRSASPMSTVTNTSNKLVKNHPSVAAAGGGSRKKSQTSAPVAVGILRALEPPRMVPNDPQMMIPRASSEERRSVSDNGEREKKKGFWGSKDKERERERLKEMEREHQMREMAVARERERERETRPQEYERGREQRRDEDSQAELTRMIGYLTATASEDWALVLEVCDRASASEHNAKEAVRALRREFKYGEPPAQLSAARLWAIMLRNSNDLFIAQSTSRKFLDTIEDLLSSARTSPVVRERLLEVVAAAAYASGNKKGSDREGFKGLWRRVKPFDKPDEGVPFDTDDAMFNPPTATTVGGRVSGFDVPTVLYQEASPLPVDSAPNTPVPNPHLNANPNGKRRKSPTRNNRIIPLDEDMRRLFQECKIAQGNASLLAQALALAKPEELKKQDIIKEFYAKCRASQELIFAQIPWASSLAEKSIAMRDKDRDRDKHGRSRKISSNDSHTNNTAAVNGKATDAPPPLDATIEEQLLAALLAANAELMEALKVYDDLKRVALERRIEDQSRRDARSARRARDQLPAEPLGSDAAFGSRERERSRSRSRTPSPESRSNSPYPSTLTQPNPHPHPQIHAHAPPAHTHAHVQPRSLPVPMSLPDPEQNLAPPPAAPHGPRLPAHGASSQHSVRSVHSRTPSPGSPARDKFGNGNTKYYADSVSSHTAVVNGNVQGDGEEEEEEEYFYPTKPSAKALGKRKLVEPEPDPTFPASGNGASFDPDDIYYGIGGGAGGGGGRDHPPFGVGAGHDDDDDEDDDSRGREYTLFRPKVNFVYDAVAEREMMRMRMLQEQQQQQLVATNGVH